MPSWLRVAALDRRDLVPNLQGSNDCPSAKNVLESASWMTAAEVANAAGFSVTNPSAQPNRWKNEGRIFAVRHHGVDYFPGYALDARAGYLPLRGLAKILAIFDGRRNSWGMAYWFSSANSFLGGQRPQDVLGVEPEQVASAAEDELIGVAHG